MSYTPPLLMMILIALPVLGALSACAGPVAPPAAECDLELRSWVVFGRARHLYALLECPPEHPHAGGPIEFTSELKRTDLRRPLRHKARLARMTPGYRLRPALSWTRDDFPHDQLEGRYTITAEQAQRLARDGYFPEPYRLLSSNSNAAMRWVMEDIGLTLPEHVLGSGGTLGRYPGVNTAVGELTPWPDAGVSEEPPNRRVGAGR